MSTAHDPHDLEAPRATPALPATPFARSDSRLGEALLWLLLLVAFSPVVADLVRHVASEPWAAYALVFWVLVAREIARRPAGRRTREWGHGVLALGLALELLMLRAGWPRMGRPGLAMAVIGLSLALGHPRPAVAWTAWWAVPAPQGIVRAWSPELERSLFQIAAGAAHLLGLDVEVWDLGGPRAAAVSGPRGTLALQGVDGGVPLMALLSGLAWYAGARAGRRPLLIAASSAGWGVIALPIQLVGAAVAVVLCGLGAPGAARGLLTHGLWAFALGVFALVQRRERSASRVPR